MIIKLHVFMLFLWLSVVMSRQYWMQRKMRSLVLFVSFLLMIGTLSLLVQVFDSSDVCWLIFDSGMFDC